MNQTKLKKFSNGLEKLIEIDGNVHPARFCFRSEPDTSVLNQLIHIGFLQMNTLIN